MPVYCSGMFWGLTGTQHWLFIGILEPLCMPCCTIECIDFVTKLMKHAFSSQCQSRAPTVCDGSIKQQWEKMVDEDMSSTHTHTRYAMCVFAYISLYLVMCCIFIHGSLHVPSTVKTGLNHSQHVSFALSSHIFAHIILWSHTEWEDWAM